jgi:VWFA-related protein
MRRLLGAVTIIAAAAAAAGALVSAQSADALPTRQPARRSPPAIVQRTVHLDVVATDRRGQLVRNLKPSDFDLREDGRPQTIEEARLVASGPRLFAIYADEYHITSDDAPRVRQALTSLIDRELAPDDLLVVMRPLDSLFGIRLSSDREQARRIIASIDGRKGDYTPKTPYERDFWAGTPARIENARTQVAISALNALAIHLGTRNDARKNLIVVSEGFAQPTRARGQEYLATLDGTVRSANRGKVAIYAIDPSASDSAGAAEDGLSALKTLADETRGRLVASAADLTAAVIGAVQESAAYYLLAYRTTQPDDGRFHAVQIQTTRPDIEIKARTGYWSPSADDAARAEAVARILAGPPKTLEPPTHLSPYVRPWFGMSRSSTGRTRVTFVWEPAGRVPGDRGGRVPTRLVLTVRDAGADGSVVFQGAVLPTGPGMIDEADAAPARAVFEAPPGRLRLEMKIQDAARTDIDTDVRDLLVTDMRGLTIGTPEVLRARNAREFRVMEADAAAVPVSSREFSRAEQLLIRFPAYGASAAPAVTARLVNRGGNTVKPLDVEADAAGYQIALLLAPYAPAEYRVEITAVSGAERVTENVPIRITN